jgi:hypothetical protein
MEEFIKKAREIHGDLYDYSKVNYIDEITPVTIVCKHKEFQQKPYLHLKGRACVACKNAKKLSDFMDEANRIHDFKYDYSFTKYRNRNIKVVIGCSIEGHGCFTQTPACHLFGQGCPKCRITLVKNATRKEQGKFIEEARKIHGGKYNYDLVQYENNRIKVIIICPIHGKFEQCPANHLRGQGCRRCYLISLHNRLRKTKEKFIEEAREVHGDKYDYNLVNYINNRTKVVIVCPIHGQFEQNPTKHIEGSTCPKCSLELRTKKGRREKEQEMKDGKYNNAENRDQLIEEKDKIYNIKPKNRRRTRIQFIEGAKKIHGEKYIYDLVNYKNRREGVQIVCPIHGVFIQAPSSHLRGSKCGKCAIAEVHDKQRKTKERFAEEARKVHESKYNYDLVDYKCNNKKVIVICPIENHGSFTITPSNHLRGQGCSICGSILAAKKNLGTKENFIRNAEKIHGENRYDYSEVVYKGAKNKVTIICPTHGYFSQTPNNHLKGKKCPMCARRSYSEKAIRWLKSIEEREGIEIQHAENGGEFRIPNSNFCVDGYCKENNIIYEFYGCCYHGCKDCYSENDFSHPFKKDVKNSLIYKETIDREEFIRSQGFDVITIWEHDFVE